VRFVKEISFLFLFSEVDGGGWSVLGSDCGEE